MHIFLTLQPPRPESICTICYTSGTTGMPKGVMLTHENVVASVCSVTMQLGEHRPTKNDVMISFLPLAHMLERCCEVRPCNPVIEKVYRLETSIYSIIEINFNVVDGLDPIRII